MQFPAILDLLLLLFLVGSLVKGYRSGLLASLSGIVGFAAGGVAAYFIVPQVGSWVPAAEWRTVATLGAAVVLVVGGYSLGKTVGHSIRRQAHRVKLGGIDRLLGGVASFVASALVMSLLAFSIGSLGIPFLSSAIGSSAVIRTIDNVTPDPVKSLLAEVRAFALTEGLPRALEVFSGPAPTLPAVVPDSPAVAAAAASVARITGNAYACGQNQSGTGFFVSNERVVTNAHVVAGVTDPMVTLPSGESRSGTIVYFDPIDDLAVIAVSGLDVPSLGITDDLVAGNQGVSLGYPFGGPFDSDPAEVISVGTVLVPDIYGTDPSPREIYTLAADVQQGESGGPLLNEAGLVVGVIFAKATSTPNVGFALAMAEVEPVVSAAAGLGSPVSSGTCIAG
jgi:S1-C subfamily serine protease